MDKKKLFEDMNISDFEKGRKAERERINKKIEECKKAIYEIKNSPEVKKRFDKWYEELKNED